MEPANATSAGGRAASTGATLGTGEASTGPTLRTGDDSTGPTLGTGYPSIDTIISITSTITSTTVAVSESQHHRPAHGEPHSRWTLSFAAPGPTPVSPTHPGA